MCERELIEREESKTVKLSNQLVRTIGETLERIHAVPTDDPNIKAGYKSVVLCFDNGKSVHLDAEMHLCKDGVLPVIRLRNGDWEMIKAAPEELREPEQPEVKPPREPGTPDLKKLDGANQD